MIDLFASNPNILYITASLLTISTILYWGKTGRIESTKAFLHTSIVGWSALMYSNFIFQFYNPIFTYYLDWIISTPLLVLALIYSTEETINGKALLAAATQVLVIATGLMTQLSSMTVLYFTLSTALLAALFYQLYLMKGFKEKPVLYGILFVTWIGYPLVWVSVDGDLLKAKTQLATLPLISKHLFALWDGFRE